MDRGLDTVSPSRNDANRSLFRTSNEYVPGGVHSFIRVIDNPICVARSAGAYFWDENGDRYIDFHAAFSPIILGHCYPAVVDRVIAAVAENDLYGVGTTAGEVAVARKIVEHVPSVEQVVICSTGSEATFHALRVARAYTGREKILKFQGCYHGWHDSVLRNIASAPERVGKRDPGSAGMLAAAVDATLVCRFNDLEDVEATVAANPEQIAAIILEPVQHNIGCVLPELAFLQGLRQIADREGIVLIFDEVITGFRHDIGGYQAVAGVTPDLTTLGKAIANGFPIAAVGGKRDIMSRFNTRPGGDVFISGTYNGHASTTAAALATIEILEQPEVYRHIFGLGEKMRSGLRAIVERGGYPCTVAGFGSVFTTYFAAIDSIRSYSDVLASDAALYVRYRQNMVLRGIFETPLNLKRNQVSLSHTEADIDAALEIAEISMRETFDGRARGEY